MLSKTDNPERWLAKCCETCEYVSWSTVGGRDSHLRECWREERDDSLVVHPYECCEFYTPGRLVELVEEARKQKNE